MNRRLLIAIGVACGLLLVATGVAAGMLIAQDPGSGVSRADSGNGGWSPFPGASSGGDGAGGSTVQLGGIGDLLPPETRAQLQQWLDSGTIPANQWQQFLRLYETQLENVRLGRVKSVNPGNVASTFTVNFTPAAGGSDISIDLRGNAVIRRGWTVIQPRDLRPNEFIIALSADGGRSAYLVLAFGG